MDEETHDCKRNAASIYVHVFEIFAFYLILEPDAGIKVSNFFPRVFTSRIEIERETKRNVACVHIYSSWNSCAWTGIRLRDFEIRLKGNIPRFSGRISPRKHSLAFSSHALCYRPCQKYGIKDHGVNQSDGTNTESLRESETVMGEGDGTTKAGTEKREPSVRLPRFTCPEFSAWMPRVQGILRAPRPQCCCSCNVRENRSKAMVTCSRMLCPSFASARDCKLFFDDKPSPSYRKLRVGLHVPTCGVSFATGTYPSSYSTI